MTHRRLKLAAAAAAAAILLTPATAAVAQTAPADTTPPTAPPSCFAASAAAESYWRDHSRVDAASLIDDPQMDAALATASDVCTKVGVPDGEEFIDIPYRVLSADTAERGRFEACEDLVFGRDGAVYVQGERFTYADCDRATEPALAEANHDDAYRAAVSLFLVDTGGFVCWGQECRDESDFTPY